MPIDPAKVGRRELESADSVEYRGRLAGVIISLLGVSSEENFGSARLPPTF